MDGWLNGWMEGQMDEWMAEWMDGWPGPGEVQKLQNTDLIFTEQSRKPSRCLSRKQGGKAT